MMRAIAIALAATFCLAKTANAEAIAIRSGDHYDFTRIVLYAEQGADWKIKQNGSSATISISGHQDGFRLERVFARIGRDRISDIQTDNETVSISLACLCNITGRSEANGLIVFDIQEGAPTLDVNTEVTEIDPKPIPETLSNYEYPPVDTLIADPDSTLQEQKTEAQSRNEPEVPLTLPQPMLVQQDNESAPFPRIEIDPDHIEELTDTQQQLSERFSIAATRGILTPTLPALSNLSSVSRPQIDPSALLPDTEENKGNQAELTPKRNIRITSSDDVTSSALPTSLAPETDEDLCRDETLADVRNWGGTGDFNFEVSSRRNNLFGEFDKIDRDTAFQLAKTYVYFGFGAEAKTMLHLSDNNSTQSQIILLISEMLEGETANNQNPISGNYHCDTAISLWSFLSTAPKDFDTTINQDSIIRALRALPLHLRELFAPAVSQKMKKLGETEASDIALRSVERATDSLNADMKLARLQSPKTNIDVAPETELIDDVIESNSMQSAQAIIEKSQRIVDGEIIASDVDLDIISSFARQFREEVIGKDLLKYEILVLAKTSKIDEALRKFDNLTWQQSAEREIFLKLSKIILDSASNIDLVKFSYRMEAEIRDNLRNEDVQKILDRLSDLGVGIFSDRSLQADSPATDKAKKVRQFNASLEEEEDNLGTSDLEARDPNEASDVYLDVSRNEAISILDLRDVLSESKTMRHEVSIMLDQ